MPKTPDEIKKGLAAYSDMAHECEDCPYEMFDGRCENYALEKDALALIQQLQADNAQQARCIENMTDKLNAINDELAELQAERDAAVRDCGCFPCQTCEERENGDLCPMCEIQGGYRKFHQWRGVQKEE